MPSVQSEFPEVDLLQKKSLFWGLWNWSHCDRNQILHSQAIHPVWPTNPLRPAPRGVVQKLGACKNKKNKCFAPRHSHKFNYHKSMREVPEMHLRHRWLPNQDRTTELHTKKFLLNFFLFLFSLAKVSRSHRWHHVELFPTRPRQLLLDVVHEEAGTSRIWRLSLPQLWPRKDPWRLQEEERTINIRSYVYEKFCSEFK